MISTSEKKGRLEKDSIGEMEIFKDAYYGIQSYRAARNFPITGLYLNPEMIRGIAEVKKAAAMANGRAGYLSEKVMNAIVKACDELLEGKYHKQFIVDPIQGGAGTSINMNANEVIANRALEILGEEKGNYQVINPNDHVNYGQSTNDVIPSAGKLTTLRLLNKTLVHLEQMKKVLDQKAEEFADVLKMGRTQMQDAVPIRMGQEFKAYGMAIERDIVRIKNTKEELLSLNLGGTAIGTGLNADCVYYEEVVSILAKNTGLGFYQADDLIDSTQNLDSWAYLSGIIKTCALNLSKIANDLRLMSSGPRAGLGEINLPARQNGSSIMPGKVNPVIPEVVNQVAFNIVGNDMTITMAVESGQLELNAFEPIILYNLFESIETLGAAVQTFTENCIIGITANKERCLEMVENSVGIITAICPHVGYEKAATLAKEALSTGEKVKDLIIRDDILSENQLDEILDPYAMTRPGISGEVK